MPDFYVGFDFGTSGARLIALDQNYQIVHSIKINSQNYNNPEDWQEILFEMLARLPLIIKQRLNAIAFSGTSSTVLLCDKQGNILDKPIWYNDSRGQTIIDKLTEFVPKNNIALSPTSTLAKVYWWYQQSIFKQANYLLHQADYLGFLLHGKLGISDYHNSLKLGYDVQKLAYPPWLQKQPFFKILPQVKNPGHTIGKILPAIAQKFHINPHCLIKAGTTDSIAAFLASGVTQPGEAVTSLGSTLVLKLLSTTKIDNPNHGIYSHRLGNFWLTGGASNTGGAVLKKFFSDQELVQLSLKINPTIPLNYHYYPLINKGDRFPVNNPHLIPKLTPKPDNPILFLQGLLEGIAEIEHKGYELLQLLGATPLSKVYTAGGGSQNNTWTKIRQSILNVPVQTSSQADSAYGSAILAMGSKKN